MQEENLFSFALGNNSLMRFLFLTPIYIYTYLCTYTYIYIYIYTYPPRRAISKVFFVSQLFLYSSPSSLFIAFTGQIPIYTRALLFLKENKKRGAPTVISLSFILLRNTLSRSFIYITYIIPTYTLYTWGDILGAHTLGALYMLRATLK